MSYFILIPVHLLTIVFLPSISCHVFHYILGSSTFITNILTSTFSLNGVFQSRSLCPAPSFPGLPTCLCLATSMSNPFSTLTSCIQTNSKVKISVFHGVHYVCSPLPCSPHDHSTAQWPGILTINSLNFLKYFCQCPGFCRIGSTGFIQSPFLCYKYQ